MLISFAVFLLSLNPEERGLGEGSCRAASKTSRSTVVRTPQRQRLRTQEVPGKGGYGGGGLQEGVSRRVEGARPTLPGRQCDVKRGE